MPIEITMPRLSDTMESGTVLKWNVAEGDAVSSGDVVADVETDKATMELTVFDGGTLAKILVPEGQAVDVGTIIAMLAEDGEDASAIGAAGAGAAPATESDGGAANGAAESTFEGDASEGAVTATAAAADPADGGRVRISPVARRLADEHGLDVKQINGSGPGGRIIKRDVLQMVETAGETRAAVAPSAAAPAVAPPAAAAASETAITPPAASAAAVERMPVTPVGGYAPAETGLAPGKRTLSNMRQTIAKRLVESKTTIPHYQVTMGFNMDPLLDLRKTLNEQLQPFGVKLSVNDFLVRGCALAIHKHPEFNASWGGDSIFIHAEVNVGIAISMPPERGGGLVVGVIRNADQKSLRSISVESKYLATKARERGLSIEEMSDSTFTLSNLGMFGVSEFTAIINPPNSAILAVGGAEAKPVVRDGQITIGHEMNGTLSCDHRIIDGAMAAEYLVTLKEMIEQPGALIV